MVGTDWMRRAAPRPSGPPAVTVLQTTTEAMWVLQGVCGVEMLPANLLLRPWVAEAGPPVGHPGLAVLAQAGALIDGETVHPTIARWMQALAAADIELCVSVRRGEHELRLVIVRRERLHVAASRFGDDVTIEEVGGVVNVRDLVARILPLCGPEAEPAHFAPISVRSAALLDRLAAGVRDGAAGLIDETNASTNGASWFTGLGLSGEQRCVLSAAAQAPLMRASFAVVVHDRRGDHVGLVSASVIDTASGRVVFGPVCDDDGTWWTRIVPGTPAAATRAVDSVVSAVTSSWQEQSRER